MKSVRTSALSANALGIGLDMIPAFIAARKLSLQKSVAMGCNCGFTECGSTSWRVVATFAAVAGGWVVDANQYGRMAALALIAAFGLMLLFPDLLRDLDEDGAHTARARARRFP